MYPRMSCQAPHQLRVSQQEVCHALHAVHHAHHIVHSQTLSVDHAVYEEVRETQLYCCTSALTCLTVPNCPNQLYCEMYLAVHIKHQLVAALQRVLMFDAAQQSTILSSMKALSVI